MTSSDQGKLRLKSPKTKIWLAIATIGLVLLIVSAIVVGPLFTYTTSSREIIIVPQNPSLSDLSDSLSTRFGRKYADRTIRAARLMGDAFRLRPGAYEIQTGTTPFGAARRLGRGRQYIVNIAINNIRTPEQLAERLSKTLKFSSQEFLEAMGNAAFLKAYGLTPESAMALVVADNYEVYWNTSPESLLMKLGDRFNALWTPERRKKAEALGISPLEVEIIASIADEETNKSDEKGRICRLYYNRLKKGMKLQADPTVKYALGDFGIRRVTKTHLGAESDYNTYRREGLPPGPIRITDSKTVDAFLNSSPSDDIFMCARADMSGYHDFTSSYSEHQINAKRYQEKLNQLGI